MHYLVQQSIDYCVRSGYDMSDQYSKQILRDLRYFDSISTTEKDAFFNGDRFPQGLMKFWRIPDYARRTGKEMVHYIERDVAYKGPLCRKFELEPWTPRYRQIIESRFSQDEPIFEALVKKAIEKMEDYYNKNAKARTDFQILTKFLNKYQPMTLKEKICLWGEDKFPRSIIDIWGVPPYVFEDKGGCLRAREWIAIDVVNAGNYWQNWKLDEGLARNTSFVGRKR